jgi:DNA repair exonuclease SbcCD ATPase subunit
MRILWIEMQNFMAFGDKQRVTLDRRGLVAVLGQNHDAAAADSNGAAKSSTLEAILWVLFGKTMRNLTGDEVINNRVKKECVVTIAIEDDDAAVWEITRCRRVPGKRANDLTLLCNGQTPTQGGITLDTQDQVETLLGMDCETFVHAVLMSYGAKPFSEMADGGQKKIVEAILNIEQYARGRDKINERIKRRQEELAGVNSSLVALQQQLATNEVRIATLCRSREEHGTLVRQRRIELLKRKADCQSRIEEQYHTSGLDRLLADAKELEETIATLRKQDDEVQKKLVAIAREVGKKRSEISVQRAQLAAQRNSFDTWATTVNSLAGQPCPTCHQVYDAHQADAELGVADDTIKHIDGQLGVLEEAFSKLDGIEQKLSAELEAQRQHIRQQVVTAEAHHRQVRDRVQQRAAELQLIVQLEQQVFYVDEEVEKLDDEANPYADLVAQAQHEDDAVKAKYRSLEFKQRALDIEIRHLLFWDHGFGNQGIKSYVIESALPFLTERAQHYVDIMSGGDMTIRFAPGHVQKNKKWVDEFTVNVENAQGSEAYHGNSDGEKGRINLCIGWALGDLAAARAKKSIRFKALDEPFNHLDETGEDLVMKFLRTVVSDYETILCITHSDHLRTQFPTVMTVVKQGGFARVEE